jgi:outer membrane protein assembly factor BamA
VPKLLAALLLALPGIAAAQDQNPKKVWVDHLYPYLYYSSIDGFWFSGHYDWSSPMGFIERPEPNFGRIALDAGASTQGSYALVLDAQAPAYWDGWRVGLTFSAARANRLGYYGQGNDTPSDKDSITGSRPYFYRVSRTTRAARLTVQRRIAGPLRVLAGGTLESTHFRELPGESWFQRDRASGVIGPDEVPFNDAVVRGGVVLDWRDLEADPHRGVFAEALVSRGRGYTRTTAALRGYVHPIERLVIAARIAGEKMTGAPPISAQMTMESSEGPIVAVGGFRSLRGYHDGRFTGPGKLVGGIEARYGLIWAPRVLEIKLLAFYDAGRVFGPGEDVRLTRDGLHAAWGGGVAFALMRNTVVMLAGGKGTEGAEVVFSTVWSY